MNILRRILSFLAGSVLFLGVYNLISDNCNNFYFWFFLIVIFLVATILANNKITLSEKNKKRLFLSSIVFVVLTQGVVAYSLLSKSGWDVGVVRSAIESHIYGNGGDLRSYFTKYDNNTPIGVLLLIIYKVSAFLKVDGFTLSMIFNAAFMMTAITSILFIVYKKFRFRAYIFSWMISMFLVALSPYIAMFYTDSLGFFSVSIIIFLSIRYNDNKNKINAFLLGLAIIFGFYMKITSSIIIIGTFISYILFNINKNKNKNKIKLDKLGFIVLGIVVGILGNFILQRKFHYIKFSDQDNINRYKFTAMHFLAMGSLRGEGEYSECNKGWYCSRLVDDMNKDSDIKSRTEKTKNIFLNNLKRDFPFGYAGFMISKISDTFGDGSFFVWGDGISSQLIFLKKDKISQNVRRFLAEKNIYDDTSGENIKIIKGLWNVSWLATMIFMSIYIFTHRKKKSQNFYQTIFILTLVGIALYQGIFESRSRYIFLFLPMFILVASCGFNDFITNINNFRRKNG